MANETRQARKPAQQAHRRGAPDVATLHALDVDVRDGVALVALDRPDVHNAFDETLIAELTAALAALDRDRRVRAVVLPGAGKSFCAGADLNWMKRMAALRRARRISPTRRRWRRCCARSTAVEADDRARARRGVRRRRRARRLLRHRRRARRTRRSRCRKRGSA